MSSPSHPAAALRRSLVRGPWGRRGRELRRALSAVRRTGQLRPDHVDLAVSGHRLWVDPSDRRGREIVRGGGRGHQPALIALWREAIEALSPALAIDVGANYGELLLDARYPPGTRAIAVEANPRTVAHLRRSIAAHPDGDRIELHAVLAGDADHGEAVLRVDPRWSGSAGRSLDRTIRGDRLLESVVAVRTLDALVSGESGPWASPLGALVLKVDVEGSELGVLHGARGLLAAASAVVALVEFDPDHLRRAGTDPAELFTLLAAIGPCRSVDWDGNVQAVAEPPTAAGDLLVVSDDALATLLLG